MVLLLFCCEGELRSSHPDIAASLCISPIVRPAWQSPSSPPPASDTLLSETGAWSVSERCRRTSATAAHCGGRLDDQGRGSQSRCAGSAGSWHSHTAGHQFNAKRRPCSLHELLRSLSERSSIVHQRRRTGVDDVSAIDSGGDFVSSRI